MKKNKKILSILLAITMLLSIFSVTASASAPTSGTCGENITWTFDGSTLTISGTGSLKNMSQYRPTLDTYRDEIFTVIIESGVTSLGFNAFAGCRNLESITIPDSVKKINEYAISIYDNINLKDIYYEGTFSQWYGVELIEKEPIITHKLDYVKVHYEYESGDFEYSVISETEKTIKITKHKVIPARIDQIEPYEVEIPSEIDGYTVTEIGDYAFYGKSKISAIELPSTVTKIGDYAFYNCSNLKEITISDNVTTIGDYAFYYCESLKGINIPDGVTAINDYAFYNCYNLKEITIPDNVTTIGDYAFYDCDSLKEFEIPDSVTTIGKYAFYGCYGLKEFEIPDSVKTIGDYAFFNSNVLPTINLPASLISIGKVAFNVQAITVDSENPYFSSDDGVLFNKDKTTIIQYPVANNRESYIVPDSVKSIGYCAFYNCDGIKEITIPDGVKSISYHAFRDCDNLKEIIIPDSVTTIGKYAFYDCDKLETVKIGDNVTTIGNYAFYDCDKLETVTIPDSVTTIGDYAFGYCNNLTDVYYDGTEEQWEAISIGRNNSRLTNATIHFDHKNNHTPADEVTGVYTAPTCTEKGYTTYTCGICGIEYKDDYVNETGHIDSDNDEICDQCNRNLNTSTSTPDSDISGISGIFSIFTIIAELFEKIFSLFGFMKV